MSFEETPLGLYPVPSPPVSQVKAGIHNVKELFPVQPHLQKRHVVDMWMHEQFDPAVFTNDISILKLDEPLEFNE